MSDFYSYYKECEKINLYCFDINQYDRGAETLDVTIMLNFQGITYNSSDIIINVPNFCKWKRNKWEIVKGHEIIKIKGVQDIVDKLLRGEAQTHGL